MAEYYLCINEEGVLDQLADAIRRKCCVLLVGLGVADVDEDLLERDPKAFLRKLVQWCAEKDIISAKMGEDLKVALDKEDLSGVQLQLQEYLTETDQKQQFKIETLLQNPDEVQYIYRLLISMSFCIYLTTGYDQLLEHAFEETDRVLFKYDDASIENALVEYQAKEAFILKLQGNVTKDNPEMKTFNNGFVRSDLSKPIFYPYQLRQLLADVNMLFVGFEAEDCDFVGLKSAANKKDELKRWLLVPKRQHSEETARKLWEEDKIITLHYANRSELVLCLQRLTTPRPVNVYISYALEDEEMRKELQKHLDAMKCPGLKIIWNDGEVGPGLEKKQIIEKRLQKAEIILLLVSVDYLTSFNASNAKIEMRRAVQRHQQGKARVIPIILRSCAWKDALFSRLEPLPSSGKPINQATDKDDVLYTTAEQIKISIQEWAEQHPLAISKRIARLQDPEEYSDKS